MRFGKPAKQLFDLEIDEVSLVDRPANQHGLVAFSKRAEDDMPNESTDIFDPESGQPLAEEDLEHGQRVVDADGNVYAYIEPGTPEYDALAAELSEDDDEGDYAPEGEYDEERELVGVGKRYGGRSLGQQVFEDLSKALTDSDRDEVIAKALNTVDELAARNDQLTEFVVKMADEREYQDYTALAGQYNLPVDPARLGAVLKRAADTLPQEDLDVLDRVLTSASEQIYVEKGLSGPGVQSDVLDQVYAVVNDTVGKSDWSEEQAMTAVFAANPEAYDAFLAENQH